MSNLVSIITPCYNGESYIGRFLDSVLSQTYPNVELIIVNDGSTDNTESIILPYKDKFRNKGYGFQYISQENEGQSAAINRALLLFKGDFLTWPDSDDVLHPNAISKKVEYFEMHPDVGLVVCQTQMIDFETGKKLGIQKRIKPTGREDCLWKDLILGNNVYYSPGGYMVRSSMFREAMPHPLQIRCPREIGQNYQLMIPIAYKYPYGIIDEVLYFYSVRQGSHSREKKSYEQKCVIRRVADDVLMGIASDIENDKLKRSEIEKYIKIHSAKVSINNMVVYGVKDGLWNHVEILRSLDAYGYYERKKVLTFNYPISRYFFKVYESFQFFFAKIFSSKL